MYEDYWNAGFNLHQLLFDHVVKYTVFITL